MTLGVLVHTLRWGGHPYRPPVGLRFAGEQDAAGTTALRPWFPFLITTSSGCLSASRGIACTFFHAHRVLLFCFLLNIKSIVRKYNKQRPLPLLI